LIFEVIPAIDLREGQVVRLTQGDFDRQTVFSDNPAAVAAAWEAAGAATIHVVDLDGAAAGHPINLDAIRSIRQAVRCNLQVGGGLRTDESVRQILESGADRVVIGTALVSQPEWVGRLARELGDRLVVGIDARGGQVATAGWLDTSSYTTEAIVRRANDLGVPRGLFTDIARDGTLEGPNVDALLAAVAVATFDVIASGGIARIEDIDRVRETGAAAVIVGRALYSGAIDPKDALARSRR